MKKTIFEEKKRNYKILSKRGHFFKKKLRLFFLQNGETSLSYIFQNLFQNREIFFKIKGLLTNSDKMGDKIIKKFC